MDTDKQAFWLFLPIFLLSIKNTAASIGHGPGLVPAPLVVGWTKYVPQAVPPHAWTSTYLNTGVRVIPAPPYYAPTYPHPVAYPAQPVIPATPVAPIPLPPPTFNAAPPILPATTPILPSPAFNSAPPLLPAPTFNSAPPLLPAPTFNPAPLPTPTFNSAVPLSPAPGFNPVLSPSGNPVFKSPFPVQFPRPEVGPDSDPVAPRPNVFVRPSGIPSNFLAPYVTHPGVRDPPRPIGVRVPAPRPSYSVSELEPEDTYGPPPSPYASKYPSTPSGTYGVPRGEPLREYPSRPPVSHVVRLIARPSRYRYSELFR